MARVERRPYCGVKKTHARRHGDVPISLNAGDNYVGGGRRRPYCGVKPHALLGGVTGDFPVWCKCRGFEGFARALYWPSARQRTETCRSVFAEQRDKTGSRRLKSRRQYP